MNAEANIPVGSAPQAEHAKLLNTGFEGLVPFIERSQELRQTLVRPHREP